MTEWLNWLTWFFNHKILVTIYRESIYVNHLAQCLAQRKSAGMGSYYYHLEYISMPIYTTNIEQTWERDSQPVRHEMDMRHLSSDAHLLPSSASVSSSVEGNNNSSYLLWGVTRRGALSTGCLALSKNLGTWVSWESEMPDADGDTSKITVSVSFK